MRRKCNNCKLEYPQEEMEEVSQGSPIFSGINQIYEDGIFFCKKCWNNLLNDPNLKIEANLWN